MVAPIAVGGDQDLGASRAVHHHRRIVGVFIHDVLPAIHHGEVGRADDFVGAAMVGGQICGILGTKSSQEQRINQPVCGQRLAA